MQAAPLWLGQMPSAQARSQPNRIAAGEPKRRMSFYRWNTRIRQLGNAFMRLGPGKGDRIAVFADNRL